MVSRRMLRSKMREAMGEREEDRKSVEAEKGEGAIERLASGAVVELGRVKLGELVEG